MVQRFSSREVALEEAAKKRKAASGGFQPKGYFYQTFEELRERMGHAVATWTYRQPGVRQGTMVLMKSPTPTHNSYEVISQHEGRWYGDFPAPPYLLYQRYEWVDAETVYVCEGEKSADAVEKLGLAATTSLGGPTMPERSDWTPLQGKNVVVLRDMDEKGRFYAEQVTQICLGIGAASARIVALHGLQVDQSVSQWVDNQLRTMVSDQVRHRIEKYAASAPCVQYTPPVSQPPVGPHADVKRLSEVAPTPVEWVYGNVVPRGKLTLLIGEPGVGKSQIVHSMTAAVLNDQHSGGVLLFSREQMLADSITMRLQAMGADLSRVFALCGVREFDHETGDELAWRFQLDRDLSILETELTRFQREGIEIRMIVIDPIDCYLAGASTPGPNSGPRRMHPNNLVTKELRRLHRGLFEESSPGNKENLSQKLAELAEAFGVAILIVSDWSIPEIASKGLNRLLIPAPVDRSYAAAARSVWIVAPDLHNPERRVLLPLKSELCPLPLGLSCVISNDVVQWDGDSVLLTIDDYLTLSAELRRERTIVIQGARTELEYVKDWLIQRLANGPDLATTIQSDAKENLISMATLRRACEQLAYLSVKKNEGRWYWRLPKQETRSQEPEEGFTAEGA